MELNSSQQKAIFKKDGPCLVLAGPGSGKTAVLTRRVLSLIKSGVPAEEILVITFTKAAAIEMKERFDRLSEDTCPVTFGTFHSLFWGILQKELGYKPSDIIMGKERNRILKEAMLLSGLDEEDSVLLTGLVSEMQNFNNQAIDFEKFIPQMADKKQLASFMKAYEQLKNKYKVIDFDDMLIKAYELFSSKPVILNKWQKRFSYFLVDEMQDMNDIQFKLIRLLSDRTKNLFCVGDDDQSIYGFRGANPKLMADFMQLYPDAEQILLDYNYRNPYNVVDAAGKLISKNKNRFNKDIKSTADEGNLSIENYLDDCHEAKEIVAKISVLINEGTKPDEIAVLYRNHCDARYLVDSLINAKVPFYLKESMPNIYSHFIISDLEAYFQIAIGNSTKARLLSVINKPNRYLHRRSVEVGGTLKGMLSFYEDNPSCKIVVEGLLNDFNLLSKMSPSAAISYIKNGMGYGKYLKEEALRNEAYIEDYIEILEFFRSVVKDCRTLEQAIDKLNTLRLKVDYENKQNKNSKKDRVGLYTLHSSKGLEFENVFIISVNEGIIPSNKAEDNEAIEGERRLFYVGMTRTKANLYLSYTNKKNRDKSRFLDEINYSSSAKSSP
jgi:DNA helicase-2/ATP-dependent DNA helicase PcrA